MISLSVIAVPLYIISLFVWFGQFGRSVCSVGLVGSAAARYSGRAVSKDAAVFLTVARVRVRVRVSVQTCHKAQIKHKQSTNKAQIKQILFCSILFCSVVFCHVMSCCIVLHHMTRLPMSADMCHNLAFAPPVARASGDERYFQGS